MKKKRKKKRLKFKNIFLLLIIILILSLFVYLLSILPIRGIYVENNTYYTDEEIIKTLDLENKSFLYVNSLSASSKFKKDKRIKNIKIKRTIFFEVYVIVNEKKSLCYDLNTKKTILDTGERVDYYDDSLPVLLNNINNQKVYDKFVRKMSKVDDNTKTIISEIKYDPNEIDKERFLVSINDGNYVYLTLSKFTKINDYSKISKTLNERNGILYLDYGNYFLSK